MSQNQSGSTAKGMLSMPLLMISKCKKDGGCTNPKVCWIILLFYFVFIDENIPFISLSLSLKTSKLVFIFRQFSVRSRVYSSLFIPQINRQE